MRVTERLWREGENLVWQAAVEDPKVLTAPWTMAPRVMRPSNEPLEESPRCVEDDARGRFGTNPAPPYGLRRGKETASFCLVFGRRVARKVYLVILQMAFLTITSSFQMHPASRFA